jgi:hypothetical protein
MDDELLSVCSVDCTILGNPEQRHMEGISGSVPMSAFAGGSISGNGGNLCEGMAVGSGCRWYCTYYIVSSMFD